MTMGVGAYLQFVESQILNGHSAEIVFYTSNFEARSEFPETVKWFPKHSGIPGNDNYPMSTRDCGGERTNRRDIDIERSVANVKAELKDKFCQQDGNREDSEDRTG